MYRDPRTEPYRYIDPKVVWFSSYKQAIKKILDFHKIREKLKNKEYMNAHEFSNDIRLVWSNAMKFNHPHEGIWKMAWKLSKQFETKFIKELLPLLGKNKLNRVFMKVVENIWAKINSNPFREPVNYTELNLPTYPREIKQPFCLHQVKDRVWSYKTKEEFLKDVDLVFNNAIEFNPQHSAVSNEATELKNDAHILLNKLLIEYELDNHSSPKEKKYKILDQKEKEWMIKHFYDLDEERLDPLLRKLNQYCKNDDKDEEPAIDLEDLPNNLTFECFQYIKQSLETQNKIYQGAGITKESIIR